MPAWPVARWSCGTARSVATRSGQCRCRYGAVYSPRAGKGAARRRSQASLNLTMLREIAPHLLPDRTAEIPATCLSLRGNSLAQRFRTLEITPPGGEIAGCALLEKPQLPSLNHLQTAPSVHKLSSFGAAVCLGWQRLQPCENGGFCDFYLFEESVTVSFQQGGSIVALPLGIAQARVPLN